MERRVHRVASAVKLFARAWWVIYLIVFLMNTSSFIGWYLRLSQMSKCRLCASARRKEINQNSDPHTPTRRRRHSTFDAKHSMTANPDKDTPLDAYASELVDACRHYSDAALKLTRVEGETAAGLDASTRSCVAACERLDAEAAKST